MLVRTPVLTSDCVKMGDQVTFQLAQERPLSELYEIKLLQGDRGRPEGRVSFFRTLNIPDSSRIEPDEYQVQYRTLAGCLAPTSSRSEVTA